MRNPIFAIASYISQKGAEAIYTEEGQKQIDENIAYYKRNCKLIREGLIESGYKTFGGINSPYIWFKVPNGYTSWDYFDLLLNKINVVTTPGSGFGTEGEGYPRLSSFGSYEDTLEAIEIFPIIFAPTPISTLSPIIGHLSSIPLFPIQLSPCNEQFSPIIEFPFITIGPL